jgi:hypothetical protein
MKKNILSAAILAIAISAPAHAFMNTGDADKPAAQPAPATKQEQAPQAPAVAPKPAPQVSEQQKRIDAERQRLADEKRALEAEKARIAEERARIAAQQNNAEARKQAEREEMNRKLVRLHNEGINQVKALRIKSGARQTYEEMAAIAPDHKHTVNLRNAIVMTYVNLGNNALDESEDMAADAKRARDEQLRDQTIMAMPAAIDKAEGYLSESYEYMSNGDVQARLKSRIKEFEQWHRKAETMVKNQGKPSVFVTGHSDGQEPETTEKPIAKKVDDGIRSAINVMSGLFK